LYRILPPVGAPGRNDESPDGNVNDVVTLVASNNTPDNDKLPVVLLSAIAVVPKYKFEFPNTVAGIVPLKFDAESDIRFAPDTAPNDPDHVPVVIVPTLVNDDRVDTNELTSVPVVGNVTVVSAVEVSVIEYEPLVANVDPVTNVNVALVAGDVIINLLIDVAVATPNNGVVNDGEVANTKLPDPVLSDIIPAS
jgi:hypothetical protein